MYLLFNSFSLLPGTLVKSEVYWTVHLVRTSYTSHSTSTFLQRSRVAPTSPALTNPPAAGGGIETFPLRVTWLCLDSVTRDTENVLSLRVLL